MHSRKLFTLLLACVVFIASTTHGSEVINTSQEIASLYELRTGQIAKLPSGFRLTRSADGTSLKAGIDVLPDSYDTRQTCTFSMENTNNVDALEIVNHLFWRVDHVDGYPVNPGSNTLLIHLRSLIDASVPSTFLRQKGFQFHRQIKLERITHQEDNPPHVIQQPHYQSDNESPNASIGI
jgi:hypothetical protein